MVSALELGTLSWEMDMNELLLARTRRHVFRIAGAAVASLPLISVVRNSAQAKLDYPHERGDGGPRDHDCDDRHHDHDHDGRGAACFLKGTKIRTSRGERLV